MNKFRQWYLTYSVEITWFVIGLCSFAGIIALANRDYGSAVLNFGVAFINYLLNKR
jgi:hypothetical protein